VIVAIVKNPFACQGDGDATLPPRRRPSSGIT
jgi:hypothetical protein